MMGVYIKNEEMPESCYECTYAIEEDGICSITEGGCDWGHSRPPHCPLIEIDLVRCGECMYWHEGEWYNTCDKHIGHGFPSDYFCGDGERRNDD